MVSATIFGSCISRDILRFPESDIDLDAYYARSSWIATASAPVRPPTMESRLTSKFQQRMVDQDFGSGILPRLSQCRSDVVVLDLIDERNGVLPVVSGGYVTNLSEQKRSGWLAHMRLGGVVSFGTNEHFRLFQSAIPRVRDSLDGRTSLVFKSHFASRTDEGVAVPAALGRPAEEWDNLYSRYFDALEKAGFEITEAPRDLCVSTANHQWGVAPYHYIDEYYHWAAAEVVRKAGS